MSEKTKKIFTELEKLSERFRQSSSPETRSLGLRMTAVLKEVVGNQEDLEAKVAALESRFKPRFGANPDNKYTGC